MSKFDFGASKRKLAAAIRRQIRRAALKAEDA